MESIRGGGGLTKHCDKAAREYSRRMLRAMSQLFIDRQAQTGPSLSKSPSQRCRAEIWRVKTICIR
jgi:hypothetical protein